MVFRVEVSPQALADLDSIARYIRERGSFESAERWFNGIIDAVRSLGELPGRCALAEESGDLQTEVRFLLRGKRNRRYKVYFAIHHESRTVRVFHVRHWAMRAAEVDELGDLMAETNEGETSEAGTQLCAGGNLSVRGGCHNRKSNLMPIRRMTGFARVSRSTPFGELTLSIKTVNHRGLDMQFHMPSEFDGIEPALRNAVRKRVVTSPRIPGCRSPG